MSLATIKTVDQWFESVSPNEYNFLIDELGLHGCTGSSILFHGAIANICPTCFRSTVSLYEEYMKRGETDLKSGNFVRDTLSGTITL
jgi:hypothetical protein